MKKRSISKTLLSCYSLLIYVVLYLPIIILIIFSFNNSRINAVWSGFTLKWYVGLTQNVSVIEAMKNSLFIALISTCISTVIGTLAAVGMYKYNFKGKTILDGLLYVPIIIPEIVMGISLLMFFSSLKFSQGLASLILAHITFSISYVVVTVRSRLKGLDKSIEEAAMDLGANHLTTFVKITLPLIVPGIVAGALLAFILSLDDVIISFFVSGPGVTTLPLQIFSMVRFGVSPEINAISTIMLFVTLSIVIISEKIRMKFSNNG